MLIRTLILSATFALPVSAQVQQGRPNVPEFSPAFDNQTRAPEMSDSVHYDVEIIADGLDHPWGVAVIGSGRYLVTERSGAMLIVEDGGGAKTPIAGVPTVRAERQGGLLDVTIAADFEASGRIFFTYAKPMRGGMSSTAAATAILDQDTARLTDVEDIFVQTPPSRSPLHYGSRIVLKGDHAYITLGERSTPEERVLAQDLGTTYGKVVRIALDGDAPSDNPLTDQPDALAEIYTYGHRNPQGAALHPETGELWTLEHGPKGGDELNRIVAGSNYGWPLTSYGENYNNSPVGTGITSADGITEPRYYWDPVIAPSDFVFYEGDTFDWNGQIIAGSLRPGGIVRLKLDGDRVIGEARDLGQLGRVRDVELDQNGELLLLIDANNGELLRITPG